MDRLAVILLGIGLTCSAATPARAQDNADTNSADKKNRFVQLFVAAPDQNAKSDVNTWVLLFKNNIRFLLTSSTSVGAGGNRIINIIVKSENVDDINSDLLETSFGKQPSLQVLSTVATYVNNSTSVDNQIYLGDLKGSLTNPYLKFSQRILREDYKITREALAAVTLYAYAMAIDKALPADRNRAIVCTVLDHANVHRPAVLEATGGDLNNLFQAISTELEARSCGGKR